MKLRNFTLFFFLMISAFAFAQEPAVNQMVTPQFMLPNDLTNKNNGDFVRQNIEFFAYPYVGNKIDLRDFKTRSELTYEPDFIEIVPPDVIQFYKDVTVLIGMINVRGVKQDENALVIWLAGNYNSNEVTFFLNKNLSRNFKFDVEIASLTPNDKPYKVVIDPINKNVPQQEFWIKVPRQKIKKKYKQRVKKRIINGLSVNFQAGVGLNRLNYIYDNLDTEYPTWYDVNATEKGFGLGAAYHTRYVRFSLNANYQNVYYYTSYLNTQYDELIPSQSSAFDPIKIEPNIDKHPVNQIQYSASVGLRLFLSKSIEFLPIVEVGQTAYFPGEYKGNRYDNSEDFKLPATNFYSLGGSFEFLTGKQKSIFLDFYYQRNNWRPEGYFESIAHENLEINHNIWKFAIGYRIGLFGKK